MDTITFEQLAGADIGELIGLARRIWHAHYPGIITPEQIDYMLDRGYTREIISDEMENRGVAWLVIRSEGAMIGFISVGPHAPGVMKLHKLYLLPEYHGSGIGSRALGEVERLGRERGAEALVLNVNVHNIKAIRAYERSGWHVAEQAVIDIGSGFVMDDFIMSKRLAEPAVSMTPPGSRLPVNTTEHEKGTAMKLATRLIHGGPNVDQQTGALGVPIYQISTYQQTSVDHFRKYDYARGDNPTREALEETVASLEGGSRCLAFSSGMAAISTTLMIFSPGDHLVVCDDVYGGAYRVLSTIFSRMGISSTFVDATDPAAIEAAIRPETKGLYLETPSNPLLKITDLRGAAEIARRHGIITLVDNTFMTPYLQRPLDLGCDIVLHSGTKFLNGHSDVICGFAVVRDTELGNRIRYIQNAFGTGLGPQDSFLTLRGIKTLKVRMDQSQQNTIRIAEWFRNHPRVTAVHYPGLPEHPGYAVHAAQADGPGAVFSFELDSFETTKRLLEGSHLAAFAVSLGGVESIISYPARMSHASVPPEERLRKGITDTLVRLSVGLEDPDDLIADLEKAMG